MSERRASIRPPEMMNGSTNGIVRSNSSTRVMRTGREVEEVQRAVASLEPTRRFELEQRCDETVGGIEQQRVERPLGPRAVLSRVFRQRELEEAVELHALAAAPRVLHDHAAGADVPGAHQGRHTG